MEGTKHLGLVLWAAMHSPDFKQCYFVSPLHFRFHAFTYPTFTGFDINFRFRKMRVFVPWHVIDSSPYREEFGFDDIAF